MAVCTINPIQTTLDKAIAYICDILKVGKQQNIFFNNLSNSENAANEILQLHEQVPKKTKNKIKTLAQHLRQSFKPGEISAQKANQLGIELCKKLFGEEAQFIVATHVDKDHIHNHIIVNQINSKYLKSLNTNKKFYWDFRNLSDELCLENGLSIIQPKNKEALYTAFKESNLPYQEFLKSKTKTSWTLRLKFSIDKAIEEANGDYLSFINKMKELGYEVKDDANHGKRKYIAFRHKSQGANGRFLRASAFRLGEEYTREEIIKRLENHSPALMTKEKFQEELQALEPQMKKAIKVTERIQSNYGLNKWATSQNLSVLFEINNKITELESQGKNIFSYTYELEKIQKELNLELQTKSEQRFYLQQYAKHLTNFHEFHTLIEEYENLNNVSSKEYFEKMYKKEMQLYVKAKEFLQEQHTKDGKLYTLEGVLALNEQISSQEKSLIEKLKKIEPELKEIRRLKENIKILRLDEK